MYAIRPAFWILSNVFYLNCQYLIIYSSSENENLPYDSICFDPVYAPLPNKEKIFLPTLRKMMRVGKLADTCSAICVKKGDFEDLADIYSAISAFKDHFEWISLK